jgi:cardiolipin synthase
MFGALAAATRTIDIQSYIFDDVDQAGVRLSGLLAERSGAGVAVRVLVDGVGSRCSGKTLEILKSHGIPTCVFNPVAPSLFRPARLNHRDHRKIVVVDGDDAFAGGINFSRVYRRGSTVFSGASKEALEEGWRDTHVRIRGPGGRRFAELFADSWAKQDCANHATQPARSSAQAVVPKRGETVIQVIPSSPDSERNLTYLSVLGAVAYARESIAVTMAYFVPDEQLEEALIAAALRGVDVRLILPAFSDFSGVFHAGRSHYARLLRGKVRIYEQQNAFLHAKTVVIDNIWSTVGSTNWDWRSFVHNDEVSVVVIDEGFAGRMRRLFEQDLDNASEVSLEEWLERSWTDRVLERFWGAFERLL